MANRVIEDITYGEVVIPDDDRALGEAINESSDLIAQKKFVFSWKKFWAFTGPGWLMSIAYVDPGNLESDLQAGATAGYQLLWVLFWATFIGWILQLLAARLGVVTGKNLAQHCRETYPPFPRILLWIMTEIAIIGADIQEVIGSAIALNILTMGYLPLWAGVLITAADTFAFLFLEQKGVRKLEVLFCILIGIMCITFGVEYAMSKPDHLKVFLGVVIPNVPRSAFVQAVGILGAVIMPHNIYLHSALVQSRKIDRTQNHKIKEANFYNALESAVALAVTFMVNLFVVSVFAASFYPASKNDPDIGLSSAGDKLEGKYGLVAKIIWGVGLLAAGQSSTMAGTYAGQFVMQGFLDLKIAPWARVAVTRSIAIIPSVTVALLTENNGLDVLDEWINVLQSVQLPFAVLPVLIITQDERIMKSFKNHLGITIMCWELAVVVIAINLYLIYEFTIETFEDVAAWVWLLYALVGFIYFSLIGYIVITPRRFQVFLRKLGLRPEGSCWWCFIEDPYDVEKY